VFRYWEQLEGQAEEIIRRLGRHRPGASRPAAVRPVLRGCPRRRGVPPAGLRPLGRGALWTGRPRAAQTARAGGRMVPRGDKGKGALTSPSSNWGQVGRWPTLALCSSWWRQSPSLCGRGSSSSGPLGTAYSIAGVARASTRVWPPTTHRCLQWPTRPKSGLTGRPDGAVPSIQVVVIGRDDDGRGETTRRRAPERR
jgi:hypothetical protein